MINEFEKSMQRIVAAEDKLLTRLFGYVPEEPGQLSVTRADYIKAMEETQEEFSLKAGDPDLVLFSLEQLSRTPQITEC